MKIIFLIALLWAPGCVSTVQHKFILAQAKSVDRTDGVSPVEAVHLAQAFLIQDADLCGADYNALKISNPDVIDRAAAYQIVFDWKKSPKSSVYPIILAVDKGSGEVQCIGQEINGR